MAQPLSAGPTLEVGPACCSASPEAHEACRRERERLESNKRAALRLLETIENPVLAEREYNRYVRDLNASIAVHNAVCKPYPIAPLSTHRGPTPKMTG